MTINALQNAKWDVEKAEGDVDFNGVAAYAARAQAYAAIAQAEQLKRIADALENISGAYSIDLPAPSAIPAWRGRHVDDEPSPLDNF